MNAEGGTFRNKRKIKFTQIGNKALLDARLSMGAKGLLAIMLSRPDGWEYYMSWLEKQSNDSMYALRKTLKELTDAGYVVRWAKRGEKGRVAGWEYAVSDDPADLTDFTKYRKTVQPSDGGSHTINTDLLSNTDLPASGPIQRQITEPGKPGTVERNEKTTDQTALAFFDALAGYGFCAGNRQHLARWYDDYSQEFLRLAWKLAPTVKDVRVPRVAFVWLLNREKAWPEPLANQYSRDQKVPARGNDGDVPFIGEVRVTKDGRTGRVTEVDADERKLSLQIGEDAAESLWIPWTVTEPAVKRSA